MLNCKLTCDEAACARTRTRLEGPSIAMNDDNTLYIGGFLRAEDDYEDQKGCRLKLDVLFLHEDGFLLHHGTVFHRFLLELNRTEPFSLSIVGPERFFDLSDCSEIRLSPRWEMVEY